MRLAPLLTALCTTATLALAGVAPAGAGPGLAGRLVFLDAGHSADGGSTAQVPNGRGGAKDCQTSGTSTDGGYPEHTFNWDVTQRIRAELSALGVRTELSRADDSGPAPCIDVRAAAANAAQPDAIVSIHADGGPAGGHGFHVNYSAPPLNAVQGGPAVTLATTMRDSLADAGLTPSTYLGDDGLFARPDLAGLNLAEYPAVLVELGNMRNAEDAAVMTSADGRARYAAAVTSGIVAFLRQSA